MKQERASRLAWAAPALTVARGLTFFVAHPVEGDKLFCAIDTGFAALSPATQQSGLAVAGSTIQLAHVTRWAR